MSKKICVSCSDVTNRRIDINSASPALPLAEAGCATSSRVFVDERAVRTDPRDEAVFFEKEGG